jgi:hypothetical protein
MPLRKLNLAEEANRVPYVADLLRRIVSADDKAIMHRPSCVKVSDPEIIILCNPAVSAVCVPLFRFASILRIVRMS